MAGVELLFGPMLVGVVLNLMLYGVVCTQIYAYFQRYPKCVIDHVLRTMC
ncbi:hypothetical protein MSAN_00105500 [Mycena sanguinolenta]|uniref:Uncharacterized protein n=1 Tax=Mycena sanguinolenta TaxID=230812 RepID=A0A8H6ZD75_9AGAR|nr:hypothetical protein MSAN_00105500 [Mycena sanguinolenta]